MGLVRLVNDLMAYFQISQLAIPAVAILIIFLAYSSQYLFSHIEPSPLTKEQLTTFNILVGCLWVCYFRACTTDPGHIRKSYEPSLADRQDEDYDYVEASKNRHRWCRRCEALKPPRAHHCKTCKR